LIVLGINGYSAKYPTKGITHNSGAAIVRDGKLIAAVDEERVSRIKNDKDYPFGAIEAVLEIAGLQPTDIDHVALAQESRRHFKTAMRQNYDYALAHNPRPEFRHFLTSRKRDLIIRNIVESFRPRTVPDALSHLPRSEVNHHAAHAAGAYYTQPWPDERTLVITVDGFGDGECGSVWIGEGGRIERKGSIPFMHSIGLLYTSFTYHLGFKPLQHEGKIVGLASFGDGSKLVERLLAHMNMGDWDNLFDADLMQLSFCALREGADTIYKELTEGLTREEIAAGIQEITEMVVTRFVADQVAQFGCSHLSLAGGVFANVKLNQRILALDGVANIYVYPNMGDGGLAAGAALVEHARLNPEHAAPQFIDTCYLGQKISDAEAEAALKAANLDYSRPEHLAAEVARLLADGAVVARADGGMEYGPRALGNRTVMAACSDPEINKWLNDRFQRTEFMPFAPVILEEHTAEYFPEWTPAQVTARFMTITYDGSETAKKNIPAAIHVDGTARPQVIRRADNPGYYDIIEEYRRLTGVPSVINTSFNMHEEPIVCTASDAVRAFLDAKLDALILGPFLVVK